jgi:multiple sugar transport system permease protein
MTRRERALAYGMLVPAFVAVAALVAWPVYVIAQISLRPGRSLDFSRVLNQPLGTGNFERIFGDPATLHALVNSLIYTSGTIAPAFLFGLVTALLFNKQFPARRWLRSLLLMPWAVPGVIVSINFLWLLDASYGVVNYLLRCLGLLSSDLAWYVNTDTAMLAVILPTVWKSFPFFTITILAALQSIPDSQYEAAKVDGANPWQTFRYVTWPGISGPAYLALVLNALWTFREFDIIFASTGGGPARATETLGILVYLEAFSHFRMGTAAALGAVMVAIAAVLVMLGLRGIRESRL